MLCRAGFHGFDGREKRLRIAAQLAPKAGKTAGKIKSIALRLANAWACDAFPEANLNPALARFYRKHGQIAGPSGILGFDIDDTAAYCAGFKGRNMRRRVLSNRKDKNPKNFKDRHGWNNCANGQNCRDTSLWVQAHCACGEGQSALRLPAPCAFSGRQAVKAGAACQNLPRRETTQSSYGRNYRKAVKNCYYLGKDSENGTSHGEKADNYAKDRSPFVRQRFSKSQFFCFFDSLRRPARDVGAQTKPANAK